MWIRDAFGRVSHLVGILVFKNSSTQTDKWTGKFGRVSCLKPVPTRFHNKTGNLSQTRNPSKVGYLSLVWIRPIIEKLCSDGIDLVRVQYCMNCVNWGLDACSINLVIISLTDWSCSLISCGYFRHSLTDAFVSSLSLKVKTPSKRCGYLEISWRKPRVDNPFLNWSKAIFLFEMNSYMTQDWTILLFVDIWNRRTYCRSLYIVLHTHTYMHACMHACMHT